MSDLSGSLSGGQAISGSLSGGSTLQGGLSMGGVSPAALLNKADVITDTASGSIVSIPDGMASPVLGLSVDIEPIQDLHGYSNPWPAGGGVNKWDEVWASGEVFSNTGNVYPDENSPYFYSVNMIPVDPAKTYYIYGETNNAIRGRFYDENGDYIGYATASGATTAGQTFVPPANAAYMRIAPQKTNFPNHKISINYPATVTSYAPYSNICPISGRSEVRVYVEETYDAQATPKATIQLGQTVYGGTVDVTSGELVIDRAEYICTGNEGWAYYSSGSYFYSTVNIGAKRQTATYLTALMECYTETNGISSSTPDCSFTLNGNGHSANNFYILDTRYDRSTLSDFKSFLHGKQLVYELATPVEVTLTAEELDILFGDNNIWADSGDTTVEYRADTKKYILKKIAEALNA